MGIALGAGGRGVDSLGILGGQTEKRPCRHVEAQRGEVARQTGVGVKLDL
jgi:hypothetical protein